MTFAETLFAHTAVFGIYLVLAVASVYVARQTRHAALTAAFLAFGFVFIVARLQDGPINSAFVLGSLSGLCIGIGGTFALASLMRRRR